MNIEDVNFVYSKSEKIYSISEKFNRGLSINKKNTLIISLKIIKWLRIDYFFTFLLKLVLFFKKIEGKRIAFVFTKNQGIILEKIRSNIKFFPTYFFNYNKTDHKLDVFISNMIVFISFLSNKKAYSLFSELLSYERYNKDSVRIIKLIGLYKIYTKLLKEKKEVILFNDHSAYAVLVTLVCQKMNIKTYYVQHAPISTLFPPLFNDINVLFSMDSVNKYKRNENVKVKIACDLRFIGVKEEGNSKEESILLCPNNLDDIDVVSKLVVALKKNNYKVFVRPHPRDSRDWSICNCKVSNSITNSIWDDLKEVSIVITNESAVVLEAIYFNRKIYKASYWSDRLDNYGFLREKLLLEEYFNEKELIEAINKKRIDYNVNKLNYFIGDVINFNKTIKNIFK